LLVLIVTVTLYAPAGVPAECPTTPGLPEPPAQPEKPADKATSRIAEAARAQARRRNRLAKANTQNRPTAKSNCSRARTGSNVPGRPKEPGGTNVAEDGAVVVTVAVTVTTEFNGNGDDGDTLQEPAGIVPVQVAETMSLRPPAGDTESGKLAV